MGNKVDTSDLAIAALMEILQSGLSETTDRIRAAEIVLSVNGMFGSVLAPAPECTCETEVCPACGKERKV